MKSRTFATACSSSRTARFCLKETPRDCLASTEKARSRNSLSQWRESRLRLSLARMMYFSRTAAIVLRQFYLMRGSLARVLPLFVWVAVDIVLWGFITRYLNTVARSGFNFVPVLLGAVLLWDFFTRVMHGVTLTFMEDVWSRNFLNIFASPLSIAEYVNGLVFSSIATIAIGLAAMIVLAAAVFGLSFGVYGPAILAFVLI